MTGLYEKIRPVDISEPLHLLSQVTFVDTGGTNGHIARPVWLSEFVTGLNLPGRVLGAVCRKLPAWQGIPPHVDEGARERRFHVPLVTHPLVVMRWPDKGVEVHLEAGFLYEVRFDLLHEIEHHAPVDRIHVQINTVI